MELVIFFSTIIVSILGFFVKRHFFPEQVTKKIEPKLYISSLMLDGTLYAEIHNIGEESVKDLIVSIDWIENGNRAHRPIYRYFNSNENPVMTSSHDCNFLAIGDKKKIASLPKYSDNGEVEFNVRGKGVASNKDIEKIFVIKNEKR